MSHVKSKRTPIEQVLVGGNHLASFLIGKGISPEHYDSYDQVLNLHGSDIADVWVAWRAIMDLSIAERKKALQ